MWQLAAKSRLGSVFQAVELSRKRIQKGSPPPLVLQKFFFLTFLSGNAEMSTLCSLELKVDTSLSSRGQFSWKQSGCSPANGRRHQGAAEPGEASSPPQPSITI